MEIGHLTWDGILGGLGAVVGGAIGAGGAAYGVFLQLRAERRRHDSDAAEFRKGISAELMTRTAEILIVRTAIDAALETGFPSLDPLVSYTHTTQPSLFRYPGDRLHLLSEAQRGALLTFYDSLDELAQQREGLRQFSIMNTYMWRQQCEYLRENCQASCLFGAEALAAMFGRGKELREAQLRNAVYVDEATQQGAKAAIEQCQKALRQQPGAGQPA